MKKVFVMLTTIWLLSLVSCTTNQKISSSGDVPNPVFLSIKNTPSYLESGTFSLHNIDITPPISKYIQIEGTEGEYMVERVYSYQGKDMGRHLIVSIPIKIINELPKWFVSNVCKSERHNDNHCSIVLYVSGSRNKFFENPRYDVSLQIVPDKYYNHNFELLTSKRGTIGNLIFWDWERFNDTGAADQVIREIIDELKYNKSVMNGTDGYQNGYGEL